MARFFTPHPARLAPRHLFAKVYLPPASINIKRFAALCNTLKGKALGWTIRESPLQIGTAHRPFPTRGNVCLRRRECIYAFQNGTDKSVPYEEGPARWPVLTILYPPDLLPEGNKTAPFRQGGRFSFICICRQGLLPGRCIL